MFSFLFFPFFLFFFFFSNKSRVNAHVNLSLNQKEKDDLIYRHFNSDGHRGLEDMQIQLIDHVNGEKELRERENKKSRAGARRR